MVEYLWDGEMDCGWEDLEAKVVDTSKKFRATMLETVSFSPIVEAQQLICKDAMDRFVDIARIMSEFFEMGNYYEYEDLFDKDDNAYKLNIWILLGSLTESALQMFLAFYIEDYKKSKWKQWEIDEVDEKIKDPIIKTINSIISDGIITTSQGKTLKNAIKDKIKEHTVEHPVQRIMLDEIIQYYTEQELIDKDDIQWLKCIQSNRNGIHSFESRTIGTWNDLQYCVRFWCYLLEWILSRLPDIPDYSCE